MWSTAPADNPEIDLTEQYSVRYNFVETVVLGHQVTNSEYSYVSTAIF